MRYIQSNYIILALIPFVSSFPANNFGAIANFNFSALPKITGDKSGIFQSKLVTFSPPFPDSGRTHAVNEVESPVSQLDTLYGRAQEFVANLYNPKPVVDTIAEHEKYGNDGDKFRSIGTVVIGGVESISNLLNTIVEKPYEILRSFSKKITGSLNTLGGKLVGLEYK